MICQDGTCDLIRPQVLFLTLVLLLGFGAVISNNLDSEAYDPSHPAAYDPSRPAASDPSLAAYWKFDEGTGVITEGPDNAVDRNSAGNYYV